MSHVATGLTVAQFDFFQELCVNLESAGDNFEEREKARSTLRVFDELVREDNQLARLLYAVRQNQFRTTRFLIDSGVDINKCDKDGNTALHVATGMIESRSIMIHILLDRGAAPNVLNRRGQSPLRTAVSLGHHRIIPILIEAGADVNEQDSLGQSPLHKAVAQCDFRSMYALLHGGADIFTTCEMLIGPKTLKYTLPKFVKRLWYEAHGDENAKRAFEHMMYTVDDIDNYVRNGVDKLSQKKALAVMMGSHKELGENSILNTIDPDVIKNLILGSSELVQPGDIHQLIEEALEIYVTKRLRVLGPI